MLTERREIFFFFVAFHRVLAIDYFWTFLFLSLVTFKWECFKYSTLQKTFWEKGKDRNKLIHLLLGTTVRERPKNENLRKPSKLDLVRREHIGKGMRQLDHLVRKVEIYHIARERVSTSQWRGRRSKGKKSRTEFIAQVLSTLVRTFVSRYLRVRREYRETYEIISVITMSPSYFPITSINLSLMLVCCIRNRFAVRS